MTGSPTGIRSSTRYEACFPEQGAATKCRDVASPTGNPTSQPDNFYAGIAREMILRRREKRVLDALTDLTVYLRGVREERKAVLAISDGWALFRPNQNLRRMGPCDPPPDMGRIGTDPRGRVTTDEQQAYGSYSRATCERDRMNLAELDNWQTFMDLLDRANRSNVSFYPIDSRGLPASDAPIYEDVPPALDQRILSARIETLQTLAINTDGHRRRQQQRHRARDAANHRRPHVVLPARLLLEQREARWQVPRDQGSREAAWRRRPRAARVPSR